MLTLSVIAVCRRWGWWTYNNVSDRLRYMKYAYAALCYRLASYIRTATDDGVYTIRAGVAKGLKRRGGFGFIPRRMSNEEAFLTSLDFRGKTVFDVGAYQGIYTMFFARAVGPKGRVVAFEPNPANYAAIMDNVELNGFTRVTVKAMALADRKGKADLLFPVREPARGSLRSDYQSSLADRFEARKVKVVLDTLDDQLAELPTPDFVKIDVEGAELEVLHGMPTLLADHRPSLFIEVHSGVDVRRLVRLLADSGYEMRDVDREMPITPDNAAVFENGHLYCCACAEVLAPNQFDLALAAA